MQLQGAIKSNAKLYSRIKCFCASLECIRKCYCYSIGYYTNCDNKDNWLIGQKGRQRRQLDCKSKDCRFDSCVAHQCSSVGSTSWIYNQINGGSANDDAFVDWRTKCTAVLNHYIYVPSLRAHACARDPTTICYSK